MTQFLHPLNTDEASLLTTSVWDDTVAQWMMKVQNYVQTSAGVWVPDSLDANGYKKVSVKDSALPTGAATQATLLELLAKIIASPATEAKQDAILAALSGLAGYTDGLEALITSLNGYVDGLEGIDFATQTTLSTIDAAIAAIIAGSSQASMKLASNKTEDIVFHNEAIVEADGLIFSVGGYKSLLVEITGTSSARTIAFRGRGASGVDRAITGVNLNGLAMATFTSGNDELWSFENITGLHSIIMDLQSIADGNVTVTGTAVV